MNLSSWLTNFPELNQSKLISMRKFLDSSYLEFSRNYGESIEQFFDPLLTFIIWFERCLVSAPWLLMLLFLITLTYLLSRSVKLSFSVAFALIFIGIFGMWKDTMETISLIAVSTCLVIIIGIPMGILMSRYKRLHASITPILDVMQTMPAFVYLIPVVMLLGIGRIPGLIAVTIYAIPPVIRLTCLGIQLVEKEVIEAAESFGCNSFQKLIKVQIPLALPNIMAGINQTIMLSLSMVVIASMIGVKGLGQPILKSISNQYFTMGLLNGLAIVFIAIIMDRVTQSYARRKQSYIRKIT